MSLDWLAAGSRLYEPLRGPRFGAAMRLDHTLVCASDVPATIDFYQNILGLEYRGRSGRFEVVVVDENLVFDFVASETCRSRHFAFSMPRVEFEAVFSRLQASGRPYGDSPNNPQNMRGPGRSTGALGVTYSVYLPDPNGHLLEILTYEGESDDPAR